MFVVWFDFIDLLELGFILEIILGFCEKKIVYCFSHLFVLSIIQLCYESIYVYQDLGIYEEIVDYKNSAEKQIKLKKKKKDFQLHKFIIYNIAG